MLKAFSLGCLGLLFSSVLGCAAEVAPTDTGAHEPVSAAEQTAEGLSFKVKLPRDVTAETVIPAVVAAGHAELATACERTPSAAIHILNPLTPGALALVPCPRATNPRDEKHCGYLTNGGFTGLGVMCSFM